MEAFLHKPVSTGFTQSLDIDDDGSVATQLHVPDLLANEELGDASVLDWLGWGDGGRAEKLRAEPEFEDPPSDGHQTGLAILVLRDAGVPADNERIARGVNWLLKNQRSTEALAPLREAVKLEPSRWAVRVELAAAVMPCLGKVRALGRQSEGHGRLQLRDCTTCADSSSPLGG